MTQGSSTVKIYLITLISFFIVTQNTFSSIPSPEWHNFMGLIKAKELPDGQKVVNKNGEKLVSPLEIKRNTLLKVAATAGAAIILFSNDKEIQEFVQENKTSVTEDISHLVEPFGSEIGFMIPVAGVAIGLLMKDKKIQKTFLIGLAGNLAAGSLTHLLKRTFHRRRPKNTDDPYVFGGANLLSGNDLSMPSGHTTQAFALATFFAETYGNKSKAIPVLAYSVAALSGISRIHDNQHWASDVLVGAVIGHLVMKSVIKIAKKKVKMDSFVKYELGPDKNSDNPLGMVLPTKLNSNPLSCWMGYKTFKGKLRNCLRNLFVTRESDGDSVHYQCNLDKLNFKERSQKTISSKYRTDKRDEDYCSAAKEMVSLYLQHPESYRKFDGDKQLLEVLSQGRFLTTFNRELIKIMHKPRIKKNLEHYRLLQIRIYHYYLKYFGSRETSPHGHLEVPLKKEAGLLFKSFLKDYPNSSSQNYVRDSLSLL
jgi:membrane-associated phospholipid phosphatase